MIAVLIGTIGIVVGDPLGASRTSFLLAQAGPPADGHIDAAFNAGGAGPNGAVLAVALQPDAKIVLSGFFTSYNGDSAASDYVLRLNADGTRDTTFNAGGAGADTTVYAVAVQPDGKILIAGQFTSYNGDPAASDYVMRLNPDGTRDTTFNAGGSGANDYSWGFALQPDGKILVAGNAFAYNGSPTSRGVMRLNTDGTRDATFNAGGSGANSTVSAVAVQPDGKIVIAGLFTSYNGDADASDYVTRLHADGSRDLSFNPGGTGADHWVHALALQSDGKLVIGGDGTAYNGDPAASDFVMRLNADGTRDAHFNAGGTGADASVNAIAVQSDGTILIGGVFTAYNGDAAVSQYLTRLTADGRPDTTFNPGGAGANALVYGLALQPDGRIVSGGQFTAYNGDFAIPAYVLRLLSTPTPTPVCSGVPAGIIAWWPGGGHAQDIVGQYHGTLQGGATFGTGIVGQAFSLDGIDDALVVNDTVALNPASITVEAWINPSSVPAGTLQDVVTKWGFDATVDSYFLGLFNSGGVVRVIGAIGDGATGDSGFSGGAVTLNAWSHIAMTYDAASGLNRLYLNGVSVSQRVRANGIYRTTSRVFIGREDSTNTRFFRGLIDEPTLYRRALTDAEILAIYNAGGNGKCGAVQPTAPVANAGPDQTSSTGFVQLDGTASFDPDGDAILFEWFEGATSLGRGPTLAINLGEGQHTITLAVTDTTGRTGTDTVLVTVTISQPRAVTALSLAASPNPAPVGRDVTLTASVSSPDGIPAGEVLFTFRHGLPLVPSAPLNASGVATLLIPGSALAVVGSAPLGAQYAGNDSYLPSQGSTTLDVVQAATQTRLTSSSNPSLTTGPPVFFADIVTDAAIQPSGTVEFFADGVLLCRSTVFSRERRRLASCGGAPLSVGDHVITAAYPGDQNFSASDAAALTQTVRQGTYNIVDLGFNGDAVAISPGGRIAGHSIITLGGATAYFYDGTLHPIPSLGGGTQAIGVDDVGRVFGTSATSAGAAHAFEFLQGVTTDRGTLGGASSLTTASNLNGTFVGASQNGAGETHGFVGFAGALTDLGTLGGAVSAATSISDNGSVVGVAALADGTTHAVLFGNPSPSIDLGTVGGTSSVAEAVNNAAEVAGTSDTSNPSFVHAFIWRADGGLEDLGTLLGSGSTQAVDINDAGQVVGIDTTTIFTDPRVGVLRRHAFLYANGSLRDLGAVSRTSGFVSGISNAGMVIGGSDPQGFSSNGVAMTDLATLGGARSAALAINDLGQIVGWSENAAGVRRATLWTPVAPATLVVEAAGGQEDGVVSLRAMLTSFGEPAAGKTITFSLNGRDVATEVTDSGGVATGSGVSLLGIPAGTYPNGVSARFDGDLTLVPAAGDAALTVGPKPDLTIAKSIVTADGEVVTAVTVGNSALVTFRLTVSNAAGANFGPTTGPVTVDDVLDARLTFVATGSDGRCFERRGRGVTCSSPDPLAPGVSDTFTVVTQVASDAAPVGHSIVITNVAVVETQNESANSNNTSGTASISVIGSRPPDLAISKTVLTPQGPASLVHASPSDLVTFQLRVVTDLSQGATTGAITVTDALDPNLAFVTAGSDSRCTAAGQTVTCVSAGPLAPGGLDTFTFVARVAANAALPGQTVNLTNRAGVSTPDEVNVANNVSNAAIVAVTGIVPADLSIQKTIVAWAGTSPGVTSAPARIHSLVFFELRVTNAADGNHGPTTGAIVVDDLLPQALSFVASDSDSRCEATTVDDRQNVRCALGRSLLPGESERLRISTRVGANAAALGQPVTLTNIAVVSTVNDDNAANNTSNPVRLIVEGPRRPDPSIEKTIAGPGNPTSVTVSNGALVTFSVRVRNANGYNIGHTTGPVEVTDVLNPNLTFVPESSDNRCTEDPVGSLRCVYVGPGFSPGFYTSFTIVTRVAANAAALGQTICFTNTAVVSNAADNTPRNNTSSPVRITVVRPRRPDLSIQKRLVETGQGSATTVTVGNGALVTFSVRVRNASGNNIGRTTGPVEVTDVLNPNLTFVPESSDNRCTEDPVGSLRCVYVGPGFSPGFYTSFTIVTRVAANAAALGQTISFTNTAVVSNEADNTPSNNTSSPVTIIVVGTRPPDLSIAKSIVTPQGAATAVTVRNGDEVTFELTVTNAADSNHGPATGPISVEDVLDPNLVLLPGNRCTAGSSDPRRVRCDLGTNLTSGSSRRVLIRTQVNPNAVAPGQRISIPNTASVSTVNDDNAANNTSNTVTIAVIGRR